MEQPIEQAFSAVQSALPKHASHAAQQLSTVHWLHAAEGVSTVFVHEPVVGGFGGPAPTSLQGVAHFIDQQVSIAFPSVAPWGYFASHAAMHAATGSPPASPAEPLEPPASPVVPLEPPASPVVPLEPAASPEPLEVLPASLEPELAGSPLELVLDPPEEQAASAMPAAQTSVMARATVLWQLEFMSGFPER